MGTGHMDRTYWHTDFFREIALYLLVVFQYRYAILDELILLLVDENAITVTSIFQWSSKEEKNFKNGAFSKGVWTPVLN